MNNIFKIQTKPASLYNNSNSSTFKIQTPSPYKFIIGDTIYNLTAPGNNKLGPVTKLPTVSLNLTNSKNSVYMFLTMPIKIYPLTFSNPGNITSILNLYDPSNYSNPIASTETTILSIDSKNVGTTPTITTSIDFEFLNLSSNFINVNPKSYFLSIQLRSPIAITNEITLNYYDNTNPLLSQYYNVILQENFLQ